MKNSINKLQDIPSIENRITFYTIIAWFFVVIGIISAFVILVWPHFDPNFKVTFAEVGTYYSGILTGTFSLAGLLFVYVAYLGQRISIINQQEELKLTREEMQSTRLELEGQKEQMIQQNKNIEKQRFEDIFYKQLDYFNSKINTLHFEEKQKKTEWIDRKYTIIKEIIHHNGIFVFKYFSEYYIKAFNANETDLNRIFEFIYGQYHSNFHQLFQVIKYNFEFIKYNIPEENKFNFIFVSDDDFYYEYLIIQIPEYLKFLISIYRRHNSDLEIINPLIDNYNIISPNDFKNYIDNDKHESYIKSLNL